jgi:hypothetical protein
MLAQRARRSNRKTHYSVEIFVSKVSLRELALKEVVPAKAGTHVRKENWAPP